MAYNLSISTNLKSDSIDQAKKFSSSSHGLSVMALNMLSESHATLKAEISVDSSSILEDCSEQMLAVWLKCESNKVLLRSVRYDDVYLDSYFGVKLSNNSSFPSTSVEYQNAKLILDAELKQNSHVYKFYRWNETMPRVLTIKVADLPDIASAFLTQPPTDKPFTTDLDESKN
mgnify:CR=1 FL=1